MDEELTVKEVAERLGVSTVQVTRYHTSGVLPYHEAGKRGRGMARLTLASDLEKFQRPRRGPKEKTA